MRPDRISPALRPVCLFLVLIGCGPMVAPDVKRFLEPELSVSDRPPDAAPGACYSRDMTPAIIETITEQQVVQPPEIADDGTVLTPGAYRTVTEARIVQDRRDIWFETLCPADMTPQFIASLQRALAARGLYEDAITAEMNIETQLAIRRFQRPEGLHSAVLSVAAAKRLGLAVYDRAEAVARR